MDNLERDDLGPGAPSATASLGLHLATRAAPVAHGRAVRDREQLLDLHACGALSLDDTVRLAGWTTTAGRHLVAGCLPPRFRDVVEAPWDAVRGARAIDRIVRELHVELAARCVAVLEQLGLHVARRSGLSLAADDFRAPREADAAVARAWREAASVEELYTEGLITEGERYNRQADVWALAADRARLEARRHAPERDPLAACAASQLEPVRPDALRSLRGSIAAPSGELVVAMTGTLAGGIGAHEYFVRAAEARHCVLEAAERRQLAAALLRDLDAVLGAVEIAAVDCGTARGVRIAALVYDDAVTGSLAAHLEGRVTVEDVRDRDGALLAGAGTALVPAVARRIEAAGVASVVVRDVRTCEARGGVCACCFGLAPEDALWTCVGDGVGARAAAAIAAAASRLSRRRIVHIC